MIIDARVRPPYKSLNQVLASAPGSRKPTRRSPLISGYERPQSMVQKSLDLFLKEMDEAGIDVQVLSHSAPSGQMLPKDIAVDLTRRVNDRLHAAIGVNPKRFDAFAAW